jgi:hypothetical protein
LSIGELLTFWNGENRVLLRLLNDTISEWGALLVALVSGTTVVAWNMLDLGSYINESIPGFSAALLVYLCCKAVSTLTHASDAGT